MTAIHNHFALMKKHEKDHMMWYGNPRGREQSYENGLNVCNNSGILQVWKSSTYKTDTMPREIDKKTKECIKVYLKFLPERFYTCTSAPVVRPNNFEEFLRIHKDEKVVWDFQDIYSGAGPLSLTLAQNGFSVGFPVNYRYGWDTALAEHQEKLNRSNETFRPRLMVFAWDFFNWNSGSKKRDQEQDMLAREHDEVNLDWMTNYCGDIGRDSRYYMSLVPAKSMIHQHSDKYQRFLKILHGISNQLTKMCGFGLKNPLGEPLEYATKVDANFTLRFTKSDCAGHSSEDHGLPNQVKSQKEKSIGFTDGWNKAMIQELKHLKHDGAHETLHSGTTWTCKRCKHGNQTEDPHTYERGKCRLHNPNNPQRQKAPTLPNVLKPGEEATKQQDNPPEYEESTKEFLDNYDRSQVDKVRLLLPTKSTATPDIIACILDILEENVDLTTHSSRWVLDEKATTGIPSRAVCRTAEDALKALRNLLKDEVYLSFAQVTRGPRSWRSPIPMSKIHENPYRISIVGYSVLDWEALPVVNMNAMKENYLNARINTEHGEPEWMITLFCSKRVNALEENRKKFSDEELKLGKQDDRPKIRGGETIRPNFDLKELDDTLWKADTQRRKQLLLGAHVKLWHATAAQLAMMLRRIQAPDECLDLVHEVIRTCKACMAFQRPPRRPTAKIELAGHFGECVQWDLFFLWGIVFIMLIDTCLRWKLSHHLENKEGITIFKAVMSYWLRHFGPIRILESDQEGGATSDFFTREAERPSITLRFRGSQGHTGTGLVERHIQLTEVAAKKTWFEVTREGLNDITKAEVVIEVTSGQNTLLEYGGYSPNQALFGQNPRGYYEVESQTELSNSGAGETTPGLIE